MTAAAGPEATAGGWGAAAVSDAAARASVASPLTGVSSTAAANRRRRGSIGRALWQRRVRSRHARGGASSSPHDDHRTDGHAQSLCSRASDTHDAGVRAPQRRRSNGTHAGGAAYKGGYDDGNDADGGDADDGAQRHDGGHAGTSLKNCGNADGGAQRLDGGHAGGAAHNVRYADGGDDDGGA